jgi:hypothetical protein
VRIHRSRSEGTGSSSSTCRCGASCPSRQPGPNVIGISSSTVTPEERGCPAELRNDHSGGEQSVALQWEGGVLRGFARSPAPWHDTRLDRTRIRLLGGVPADPVTDRKGDSASACTASSRRGGRFAASYLKTARRLAAAPNRRSHSCASRLTSPASAGNVTAKLHWRTAHSTDVAPPRARSGSAGPGYVELPGERNRPSHVMTTRPDGFAMLADPLRR